MNDDELKVIASLDITASTKNIKRDLETIAKQIGTIQIKASLDTKQLKAELGAIEAPTVKADDYEMFLAQLDKFGAQWKNQGIFKGEIEQEFHSIQRSAETADMSVGELNEQLGRLRIAAQTANSTQAFETSMAKYNNDLQSVQATLNAIEVQNPKALEKLVPNNEKLGTYSDWIKRIRQQIAELPSFEEGGAKQMKAVNAEIRSLQKSITAFGLDGKTAVNELWDSFKKLGSYIGQAMIISVLYQGLAQIVTKVKEIDTAMTELRKVTDATDAEFESFFERAVARAQKLSARVTDIINATTEFSRLGYNLDDAADLGEVATLYKVVGDGITSTEASKSLISTLQSFGDAEKSAKENAEYIVDMFNEIGKMVA